MLKSLLKAMDTKTAETHKCGIKMIGNVSSDNNGCSNNGTSMEQFKCIDLLVNQNLLSDADTASSNNLYNIITQSNKTTGIYYDPYITDNESNDVLILKEVPHYLKLLSNEHSNDINRNLVQNVIYSFIGIESEYLKKDAVTGRFKLSPEARNLDEVQCAMLLRLSELGFYHDSIARFANPKYGVSPFGQLGQGLIKALKYELNKFYGMVSMLHDQLNIQRLELVNAAAENKTDSLEDKGLTLMKIAVWYTEPLHRLQWVTKIARGCQMKKGGELASVIYDFLNNGSPAVRDTTKDLLKFACGPLLIMITQWLLEGEVLDTQSEFFIECISDVGVERLWYDKYRLRVAMLPKFITTEMANKILITGKSVSYLRAICQDHFQIKGRDELELCASQNPEDIFAYVPDTKLHLAIETIYQNTSKRVLDIMLGPQKLLEHWQSMRRYLLLGQGDFVGILMENMKMELDKPAFEVCTHELSTIMDAALRATNAQHDNPEILNHLDVRVMTPFGGETGWDIIALQYTVEGPISTMLEPSMGIYMKVFKPLWRMKHIEFVLSTKIWKDQKVNAKVLRSMAKDLLKVFYRLNLLTSEMMHFIHQMQYYILFEVIECSWVTFQKSIENATTLDSVLEAHALFLKKITRGSFLDLNYGEINTNLDGVYDNIKRLEIWQDKFYNLCFKEFNARNEFQRLIRNSEKTGEFGVTTEKQFERDQSEKIFQQILNSYHKTLEHICQDYEKTVNGFMLALNSNEDPSLQLFGVRLDFNEYYKKRDTRLNIPLTFEHMRMSCVYSGQNKSFSSRYSNVNLC